VPGQDRGGCDDQPETEARRDEVGVRRNWRSCVGSILLDALRNWSTKVNVRRVLVAGEPRTERGVWGVYSSFCRLRTSAGHP